MTFRRIIAMYNVFTIGSLFVVALYKQTLNETKHRILQSPPTNSSIIRV